MQAEPQTRRSTTYDTWIARFTSANLQTENTAFGPVGHDRERTEAETRAGREGRDRNERDRTRAETGEQKRETRDKRFTQTNEVMEKRIRLVEEAGEVEAERQ